MRIYIQYHPIIYLVDGFNPSETYQSQIGSLTVVCAKIPSVANAIESNETCHGCNQKAPLFADISAQCTAVHTC